ncbi:hypothetical protein GS597_05240 [Synechococcales cyanobacterium C]|uniref:Tetratricopeptide repeat protein n=1 Tax=Petrachloros mirabilis ULC683 TaxID=2781853 RepID=A0A8K1ZVF6_9CYAN|nr:hypothetical protein [Petrachloros mirabilis]NCJ05925.1 hypothetical protein [Petrachloros mirabilis ULC683]
MKHASLLMSVLLGWGGYAVFPSAAWPCSNPMSMTHPSPHSVDQVPLFDNLGNHEHPISTQNPLTQRYFNQGVILAYGFNHAEAARAFQQAAALDPTCAMCYWGLAYVLGPNINAPMDAQAVSPAYTAIQQAVKLSDRATNREKAYIQALAQRYVAESPEDRSPLDLAYAKAMGTVAQRHPDDLDAATLYAEALMDTTPWDYWEDNGDPKPIGAEIMATLERVIAENPNHAGANHLYIHAVEKERPELGIAAADRLMTLVPGSGHLVHMPSHIYIRVGRYHDAVVSNQRAIEADRAYAAHHNPKPGIYSLAYMPHNHHFLWFAALMTGQSRVATEAARHTAHVEDPALLRDPGLGGALQHYASIPLFTQIRFSQWEQILATPAPDGELLYPLGIWHYAQGMAQTNTGQLDAAAQSWQKLAALAAHPTLADLKILDFNVTADVLKVATAVLAGELAAAQKDYDAAVTFLQEAVQLEKALVYTEPPDWYHPTRQSLAAVLLKANRAAEAEATYREDLAIYPNNGWSLYGLAQSLRSQNKLQDAQAVETQLQEAWQYADVTLASE